jgi:hypothetical protein
MRPLAPRDTMQELLVTTPVTEDIVEIHPPDPLLIHPLPPAPSFFGREQELQDLRHLWQTGCRGVVALVGLGGAGKTAVAARFLEELLCPDAGLRPAGLFVWSFYQAPDAGQFLQQAYQYFGPPASAPVPARGAGLLHLLHGALAEGGPHLLVLDGLERVQSPGGTSTETYGQVEDPLLRGLLTRIAEGIGQTTVLVTSRFPLTDLAPLRGGGYHHLEVGGLSQAAAVALLRSRGVRGDDAALAGLVESYGAHALTLDHLGGLLGQFLEGDPARAPELPALGVGGDRQALRLTRLLRAYEEHLPAEELGLLCRLCLLRRSVHEAQIVSLFLCSPPVHARTVRELAELIPILPGASRYPHKSLDDLAETFRATMEDALCTAPLAGPEEAFREDVRTAVQTVFELYEERIDADVAELARLYADPNLDAPTEYRPLPAGDRPRLSRLCENFLELHEQLRLAGEDLDPILAKAFKELGWGKKGRQLPRDMNPSDLLFSLQQVRRQLRHYTAKHFALRHLRELCRLAQQKWALAGPLAPLEAGDLRRVLYALVARHLVLREADGSVSVHPAVRDHFGRLGGAAERGSWHQLIHEQLVSLVQRPGHRLPEDPATLDLVEEAIHHALQAGRTDEARCLYQDVLGGLRHLAWKLGETARGLRILREFDPCPDPWALAWHLRALGELDRAAACNSLPYFRADIFLLQGRLPQVAAIGDSTRTATAAFLMGKTRELPHDQLGAAVPREQILIYLSRLDRVHRSTLLETFYHDIGWEGDRARCRLFLAEAARRQGDLGRCHQHLQAASAWIIHSGSVEHLCLWHLLRARVARSRPDRPEAHRALEEGLHLARQCDLGLYHVELLCEQAELCRDERDLAGAEGAAREALQRAAAADCQFLWGAAQAGHLIGQVLLDQERPAEARDFLHRTLLLRQRLGDPGADTTERLLAAVGGQKSDIP